MEIYINEEAKFMSFGTNVNNMPRFMAMTKRAKTVSMRHQNINVLSIFPRAMISNIWA